MMGLYTPSTIDPDEVSRFELLYRAHADDVIAYAARRVSGDGVADVVAETFAIAWRRFDQVPEHPLPWLLGVARRVAANQRRGQRRRDALVERVSIQPLPALQADAGVARVLEALADLPERDREVLRLAAWDGLSAAEAAQVLGCTATAYRLRLHRARRKLAARLETTSARGDQELRRPSLRPEERP
jgi:RNA polymerase sigma factor (sigma-70 family)